MYTPTSSLFIFSTSIIPEPSTKIPHSTPDSRNLLKLKQTLGIFEEENTEDKGKREKKRREEWMWKGKCNRPEVDIIEIFNFLD